MKNSPELNAFATGMAFMTAAMAGYAAWVWFDMPSDPWRDASGAFAWSNSFWFMAASAIFTVFGLWRALKIK